MKLKTRNFLILILALCAVIFSAVGLVACGGDGLADITVENAKTEFMVGDEFSLGEFFKVYANYTDGTQEDVTEQVEIKKETGFDMNVAGDYQITVGYLSKKSVYTIYVGSFENILRKIELDTTSVKKNYKVGESVSFEGIKITSTFENAQGKDVISVTSSLKDFTVKITDKDGKENDGVFTQFGTHTVTISKGAVKASYAVEADGVNLSSVQGALAVGSLFKGEAVTGDVQFKSGLVGREPTLATDSGYEFGQNYIYVQDKLYYTDLTDPNNPKLVNYSTEHMHGGVDEKGFFSVKLQDDLFTLDGNAQSAMMSGPKILLWYNQNTEYGIENALNNLYAEAKKASNNDLKETADEANKSYSFSFSGLVLMSNNSLDYYETSVTFSLDEKYCIKQAEIVQCEWENDQAMLESDPNWQVTFKTDPETGITTPNGRYSSKIIVTATQSSGERTKENPYDRDMFTVRSYDLKYNGETLDAENAVIKCDMATPKLTLVIDNVLPTTANFKLDTIYFNYEGSHVGYDTSIYFEGFSAYEDGGNIKVVLKNGGVWKLYIKTAGTLRTVTFDVKGVAPTAMTASIRNAGTGAFVAGSSKTVAFNGEVYFCGAVSKYADYAQSAVVTSSNASSATIEKFTEVGSTYFKFTATQMGVYTVRVTSDAAPDVGCTFTFTVSDVPDYDGILQGKYSVTDIEGNIYELSFSPAAGDKISGNLTVKKTPTNEADGTPITAETKSEIYTYEADTDTLEIILKRVSGDKLAVLLSVDADGSLVLEDAYGKIYKLAKKSS